MGYKFAIASGNWSNPLTWNDGVVPSSVDTVYSNSFTVVIDQNINVASLTNLTPLYYLQNQIIPLMTSNVSPSGLADATTNSSNAYLAFNGNKTDYWGSGIANTGILIYRFDTAKTIKRYSFSKGNYYSPKNFWYVTSCTTKPCFLAVVRQPGRPTNSIPEQPASLAKRSNIPNISSSTCSMWLGSPAQY